MTFDTNWRDRAVSPADVVSRIPRGARIFVHGAAATPTPLLDALAADESLEGLRLYHLHLSGRCAFAEEKHRKRIHSTSLFTGPALRGAVNCGQADFMPIFLAEIPSLFTEGAVPLDAVLLQVSPPDAHGNCSLGTSVDAAMAAARSAKLVFAEINEKMPRTHGNTVLPFRDIDAFCVSDRPLFAHEPPVIDEVTAQIGENIAALVEDGSTLQMGIGAIPDAALARLGNKRDLGIHTEMFSDGVIELAQAGVINNKHKEVHAGRIVTSFVTGSQKLYDFVHDNPQVEFHPCNRTNDTRLIRQNPKVVAINSALEVDLSGQVCADSLGSRIYSGIGGQMDFIRGAAMSKGGKPIIALPSTAAKGTISRIAATLKPGSGVVTTRGHVRWVITEYGAVNLHGRSLRERGELLISIAHPDFRAELRKDFKALRHFV